MAGLITDEILEEIAVVGPLNEIAGKIRGRCGEHADRVSFGVPYFGDADYWTDIARELREDSLALVAAPLDSATTLFQCPRSTNGDDSDAIVAVGDDGGPMSAPNLSNDD